MTDAALQIGALLRETRESHGLSVGEVAQQLKFAPRQLEALEREKFEELPGGTFVRGMLRSYARLLKLDPEPLVEQVAGRFAAPDAGSLAARYSQPVPFSDSARRSTFVYLGLSLGVLALGGGVAYEWYREHSAPASVAVAKRPPPEKPEAAPAPQPKLAEEKVIDVVKAAPKDQPNEQAKPAAMEKVVAPRSAAPAAVTAANVTRLAAGIHRLVIQCDDEAWIEVKDANDRLLVSSLNPKGTERIVQARGPLTLVIGNAQRVRVLHNNRPVDLAPHTKLAIARFTLP
jgi:cytoskeleton protein RodZ